MIFNAHHEALDYKLPDGKYGKQWIKVLDTGKNSMEEENTYRPGETVRAEGRSVLLLCYPDNGS